MFRRPYRSKALFAILGSVSLLLFTLLLAGSNDSQRGGEAIQATRKGMTGQPGGGLTGLPGPKARSRIIRYTYDDAGRLVGADYADNGITYSYDAAGNLLQRNVSGAPLIQQDQ